MTDLQGLIDGKYEVLAKIREGGMGAVYKVRHLLLDEVRVIKVVHPSLDADAEVRARFLREARAASRLRHPNVTQLFDFMIDPAGDQFLVLEYIDGLTLRDLLRRHGPPSLALAVEIARQSLAALAYLHRHGFVHRDIAPDNLMLTRGPDGGPLIKLIDLGIAKGPRPADHGLTGSGIFLGKPRYAAPEALEGHEVDARADLYSFGVVLYELLTGERPFEGKTPHEVMAAHLRLPPRPFSETDPEGRVPVELREAVLAALVKSPARRVLSAEELAHRVTAATSSLPPWTDAEIDALVSSPSRSAELATFQGSGYTTHAGAAPPPPVPGRSRRRRALPVVLAGLALASALGLWILTAPRDEPAGPGSAAPAMPAPEPPAETTQPPLAEEEPAGETSSPAPLTEPRERTPAFVPARLARPLSPVYPQKARGAGGTVRATVDAQIDETGKVVSAAVPFLSSTTSTGPAYVLFKEAALRAIRDARFEPARRNGVPVRDKVRIVVVLRPPP